MMHESSPAFFRLFSRAQAGMSKRGFALVQPRANRDTVRFRVTISSLFPQFL
jgi:hypothetical protein